MFAEIDAITLKKWMEQGNVALLDIREHDEYQKGHIPQAQYCQVSEFSLHDVDLNKQKVVLYCNTSRRSGEMLCNFYEKGAKDIYHLGGGYLAWVLSGFEYQA